MIVYKSEFEGVKSNGLDLKLMTLIKGHDLLAGYRPYDAQFLFARGDEEL